ncbi:hypothetical protein Tco_0009424 [Tanacetum coccineum]
MAKIKTNTTMEEFMTKDRANYYSGITSITVNGKAAYELKGKFLDDLRDNAFSRTNGEDAIKHIEYFLKIVDPIDLPNVNYERLRLAVFPISLVGNASKWFDELKGLITTWVDLTENFFGKYYPPSRTCNVIRTEAKKDLTNTMFEEWLASKFANHMMMDPFTREVLQDFWKKTYEDYESELNNEVGEPWSNDGVPYEICDHICEPFRFKNGETKWPTCNSNEDGFCNGGKLSGMVQVGYMTYFQDYEWYDDLTDISLKEEALNQKAIYEKSWGEATQSVINFCEWLKRSFKNFHELDYESLVKLQECWLKINDHECSSFANWINHIRGPYANINTTHDPYFDERNDRACNNSNNQEKEEQHEEGRHDLFDDPAREPSVCKIRRFEMIKYSFRQE